MTDKVVSSIPHEDIFSPICLKEQYGFLNLVKDKINELDCKKITSLL